jgi:hypothetical protein
MSRFAVSAGLAIALLLAPVPASLEATTPPGAITWTVDHHAKKINVLVRLQIYSGCGGDPYGREATRASACNLPRSMLAGPTQLLADKIKSAIERVWNKPYKYRCYELRFEVDIKLGTDPEHIDDNRIGVQIDPSPGSVRSYVHGQAGEGGWWSNSPDDRVDPENDTAHPTTWAETQQSPYTWAHEFGHILGLDDAYDSKGPLPGAPIDLMSTSRLSAIDQQTIDRMIKRNLPNMRDTQGKPVSDDDLRCGFRIELDGNFHLDGDNDYDIVVPEQAMEERDDGSYVLETPAIVTGRAGFNGCSKSFAQSLPLRITVKTDSPAAPTALVRVELASGTGFFSVQLTCHGILGIAPITANLWVDSFYTSTAPGVTVPVDSWTTVEGKGGSAPATTVVTLKRDGSS